MKSNAREIATPFIKYSLISFHQYCRRDLSPPNTLLYSHDQNMYVKAYGRRTLLKTSSKNPNYKVQKLSNSERYTNLKNTKSRDFTEHSRKKQQTGILNVTPAVIHTTATQRLRDLLSQRAKNQQREHKRSKTFRCKTEVFDQSGHRNDLSPKHSFNPLSTIIRPSTANQRASGLNKIKVFLPLRPASGKLKEEQINGWQDPFEDEGL